jgi:hypothetical protein
MQKYILPIKLMSMLIFSLCFSQSNFSWLNDIKGITNETSWWYYPVVVVTPRPSGGYIAFWAEREEMREEYSFPPEHYFYRVVDTNRKIIVEKEELDFWRVNPHPAYFSVKFNSESILWLDSNKLLIIGWKSTLHQHKLERVLIDSIGNIISGPDSVDWDAVGSDAVLVRDGVSNVYAVDYKYAYGVKIMQVYPKFSNVKIIPKDDYRVFREKYPAHTFPFWDLAVVPTSGNKLLLCGRLGWGPNLKDGVWDRYRPDKIFYFLFNLDGNFVVDPVIVDISSYAYHKIRNVCLGGIYYSSHKIHSLAEAEAAVEDIDLSTLPNGEIILSVTGIDENGKLCVYQMKFSPEGEIRKPNEMNIVDPRPFVESKVLPVLKVMIARSVKNYLVEFGFDEEGNFYSEREVWGEKKK